MAAPLLDLPPELLGPILDDLGMEDLSNLALASKQCHQLAQGRLFRTVTPTALIHSTQLVQHLIEEYKASTSLTIPNDSNHPTRSAHQTIGSCIRHLRMCCEGLWLVGRDFDDGAPLPPDLAQRQPIPNNPQVQPDESWVPFVKRVATLFIHSEAIMTNLVRVDIINLEGLADGVFKVLCNNRTVKDVRIHNCRIVNGFVLKHPLLMETGGMAALRKVEIRGLDWNIRNLHLDIQADQQDIPLPESHAECAQLSDNYLSINLLTLSILAACAPTLETLTLCNVIGGFRTDRLHALPEFPRLRQLRLGNIRVDDTNLLDRLVHDRLTHLSLRKVKCPEKTTLLQGKRAIPTLRTFLLREGSKNSPELERVLRDFLRSNPWLQKINLSRRFPQSFFDMLLPLLETSFLNLTSLGLSWTDGTIAQHSLEAVSRCKSLRQLRLSSGYPGSCYWPVDHEHLQQVLNNLPSLQGIVLQGITNDCPPPPDFQSSAEYAIFTDPGPTLDFFEPDYKRHVVERIKWYVAYLPQLQWIKMGNYHLVVRKTSIGTKVLWTPSRVKWFYEKTLQYKFGWRAPLDGEGARF